MQAERKPASKPQQQKTHEFIFTTHPILRSIRAYEVIAVTDIQAPLQPKLIETLKEHIAKKYGEGLAEHIDRAFERNEVARLLLGEKYAKYKVYIPGSAVYSALKDAAGIPGEPLYASFSIFGIVFPEDATRVKIFSITLPDKLRKTLSIVEVIPSGTPGLMIVGGDIPEKLKSVRYIMIGRGRKRGFGLIQILWEVEIKPEKT